MSSAILSIGTSEYQSRRAEKSQEAATERQLGLEKESEAQIREDFAPYRAAGGKALSRLEQMMGLEVTDPYAAEITNLEQQIADISAQPALSAGKVGGVDVSSMARQALQPKLDDLNERLAAAKQKQTGWAAPGEYDITQTPGYQFRLEEGYKGVERSQAGRRLGGRAAKEMARYGQEYASTEYGAEYDRLRSMADIGLSGAARTSQFGAQTTARVGDIYRREGEFGVGMAEAKGQMYQQGLQNLWTAYNQPKAYDPSLGSSSYDPSRTSAGFR